MYVKVISITLSHLVILAC